MIYQETARDKSSCIASMLVIGVAVVTMRVTVLEVAVTVAVSVDEVATQQQRLVP